MAPISVVAGPALVPSSRGVSPGSHEPPNTIYQHPLAYLLTTEGLALLRSWSGDFDEEFVRARLDEVRRLMANETLASHPGVHVESGATDNAYRQWAPTYDEPGNDLLVADLRMIDEVLAGRPAGTAVDAACGTGRLARRLVAHGHRVLGVDRSPEMVQQARRAVPDVAFAVGDLEALPVGDATVDVLTNALALAHVADLAAVFAEFARVLRPGGVAIVSDAHPELVRFGSVPKAIGPGGQPQQAAAHQHTVADYLRAALAAGFLVRGFYEPGPGEPSDEPPVVELPDVPDLGEWRDWPWSLLRLVPAAAAAAWNVPSVLVWHLERR